LDAAEQAQMVEGDENDWTWESHELAMHDVYYKLRIAVEPPVFPANCSEAPAAITELKLQVDARYVDSMKPVVREQLIKGGLRLAKMLNEAL
jgi:hypothetical protein